MTAERPITPDPETRLSVAPAAEEAPPEAAPTAPRRRRRPLLLAGLRRAARRRAARRVLVVAGGPLHREHRQRLCRRATSPCSARASRATSQAIKVADNQRVTRRRSADRAGSRRLAARLRAGRRRRGRGRRRRSRPRRAQVSQQQATIARGRRPPIAQARGRAGQRATADAARSGSLGRAAGPRARPTSRRWPTRARPMPHWPPPRPEGGRRAAALPCCRRRSRRPQARQQSAAAAVRAGREQPGLHRDPRARSTASSATAPPSLAST